MLVCPSLGLNITDRVFGSGNKYLPAAFGDFNSDKLTDLFVLTEDGKTIEVLIAHTEPPLMHSTDMAESGPRCTYDSLHIRSVVPGDFDGNGAMDILLVSLNKSVSPLYQVFILWGNLINITCGIEDSPLLSLYGQPLVMDYNGDMIPDLFGEDENRTRTFWVFGPHRKSPQAVPMMATNTTSLSPLKDPSSHAFIDVNNDLAADLWVSAEKDFELWTMKSEIGYTFDYAIKPLEEMKVVGQTSFADVNLDGHIEAVVPVCKDLACTKSALYIYSFETKMWIELDMGLVDTSGTAWTYNYNPGSDPLVHYSDTITLRMGDFNLDGYPDFLVTLVSTSDKTKPRVTLMENGGCEDGACKYPRKFLPRWSVLEEFGNTVLGVFCDFEEDGTLDVLMVRQDNNKYQLSVYKDDTVYDAVFVKVLILTGHCYGDDCPLKNIPYGTNQPGPSITYTITTATGGPQWSRATQLSQTAHTALQLPYTLFGLGRNWNFVEVMQVGIPKSKNHSQTLKGYFTQIIPNSQLIVIPNPIDRPNDWVSKLFITPSKAMLMTAGALVGTCVFVAAIIGILHHRDMQQDKREKQQNAHKFHFDAM
ncbi:hypothetical protein Pmani_028908 [Petrolisthes manimaculis]|uniref:T-cell immunomodulatory protein TIP C2 domain-containing protein n=1 Tax=Petrolisthes manimaculis TaxID=1843537 RepID=A0AAE1P0B9_9EUCA|nr:hypothetical protein Pmani_028908 [Petrolisthes manimaculis]